MYCLAASCGGRPVLTGKIRELFIFNGSKKTLFTILKLLAGSVRGTYLSSPKKKYDLLQSTLSLNEGEASNAYSFSGDEPPERATEKRPCSAIDRFAES